MDTVVGVADAGGRDTKAQLAKMACNHPPAKGGEYLENVVHELIEFSIGNVGDRSSCG
jgi:hypothetical protein